MQRFGRFLSIATAVGVVASVAAFLLFVFADTLIRERMERRVRAEVYAEGLARSSMRPTPLEGFTLVATVPLPGDLHGSALDPGGAGLWIADATGGVILFDPDARTVVRRIAVAGAEAPHGVSFTADGRMVVADRAGARVIYLDPAGGVEQVVEAPSNVEAFAPVRAVEAAGGLLYVLNQGVPPGILSLPPGGGAVTVYGRSGQNDLRWDGRNLWTVGTGGTYPVRKLSSAGVDQFANVDAERMWALPFWEATFAGVDVDKQGFATIVDTEGYLIQLSEHPRVLLHGPPPPGAPGEARSVTVDAAGRLFVVYQAGVRIYELSAVGRAVREASLLTAAGQVQPAVALWERLVEEAPDRSILRRGLIQAYLLAGEPTKALKHAYLVGDEETFGEAVREEARRVRRRYLWPVWTWTMGVTVAVWFAGKLWPLGVRVAAWFARKLRRLAVGAAARRWVRWRR